jgi:hypothetical protein
LKPGILKVHVTALNALGDGPASPATKFRIRSS